MLGVKNKVKEKPLQVQVTVLDPSVRSTSSTRSLELASVFGPVVKSVESLETMEILQLNPKFMLFLLKFDNGTAVLIS